MGSRVPILLTSVAMMSDDHLINKGVIIDRPMGGTMGSDGPGNPPARGSRTFIVTGLHRSGTSLVSAILQHAGIFMGRQINDAVFEDEEIGAAARGGSTGAASTALLTDAFSVGVSGSDLTTRRPA